MQRAEGSTASPGGIGGRATGGSPAPHALAVLAAVLTWPLLMVGGSVTVYRVGMAVPDWPTTFGVNMFLYDFLNTSWGVFIEHSHRLYGAGVGLACLALAAAATFSELRVGVGLALIGGAAAAGVVPSLLPAVEEAIGFGRAFGGMALLGASSLGIAAWAAAGRRWRLALAWLALAAVVGQGILGGYRVRWNSPTLAWVHGCTAQAFFALLLVACVATGRGERAGAVDPCHVRRRSAWTLVLIAAQIALGAWLRQFGGTRALAGHAVLAAAVWGHAVALAARVLRRRSALPDLAPSAWAMMILAQLQMLAGVLAWWTLRPFDGIPRTVWPAQAAVRIAHQGLGALMLGAAVVLTLRAARSLRSPSRPRVEAPARGRAELEAVG